MLLAGSSGEEINEVKEMLKAEFDMTNLEPAQKILGIEIKSDRKKGLLKLSQCSYLEKVLQRFGMSNSKPV